MSFLEANLAISVASNVADEAIRLLRPGGLLYVVDGYGIVRKIPNLKQFLTLVDDVPSVKIKIHDIETQEILRNNGFAVSGTSITMLFDGRERNQNKSFYNGSVAQYFVF